MQGEPNRHPTREAPHPKPSLIQTVSKAVTNTKRSDCATQIKQAVHFRKAKTNSKTQNFNCMVFLSSFPPRSRWKPFKNWVESGTL
jgi:hypothetical protein